MRILRVVGGGLLAISAMSLAATPADSQAGDANPLRIATFEVDATPPVGSPLCEGSVPPAKEIVDPLSARGIVLLGAEDPIVLCAVDWVGIGNGGHDEWRNALAEAAGTTPDRVAVHTLHQHDAPGYDSSIEELLKEHGIGGQSCDVAFARGVLQNAADALRKSLAKPLTVTHLGLGTAPVEKVASNRRILGDDGQVKVIRFSSTTIPEAIAAPEGVIDPFVRLVSVWNEDRPLVSITHYATHPQSYYGQGGVSCDFVGIARELREEALADVVHVHFNGAAGNVAAGKYNDGSPAVRPILAARLADGMRAAWDAISKTPLTAADVRWEHTAVSLPLRDLFEDEAPMLALLNNDQAGMRYRINAARDLAYARRIKSGHQIEIGCLRLGPARVVYMPGELFVEYQLAAQALRPNDFVAMAAYGDYGPGYIGTEVAYGQGGYETSPVSRTAPHVEQVLMDALRKLLND